MITRSYSIIVLFFLCIVSQANAELYSGIGFIGTSNQKLDGRSYSQDGLGLALKAGAGLHLFPALDLHLRLQSSFSTASYLQNGATKRASFLDFVGQLEWRPSFITIGIPVGLALVTPAGRPESAGPLVGVFTSINDMSFIEPWLQFNWISLGEDHRYLFASFGLNWKW